MDRTDSDLTILLQEIGFSELEAEIYHYLLTGSPATGYRIAKGIGRSFTNTYKALESLRIKGAVLVDDGERRLTRAVPVEELLDQIESRFRQTRGRVVAAAAALPGRGGDNRVYRLGSLDQVLERYRQMLLECEVRALGELSPESCTLLRGDVEAAAARGLKIAVRTYAGEMLDGVRTIHSPIGDITQEAIGTQWLSLFIDGRQFLMANIDTEAGMVLEAVWSESIYLAREIYSYVNADLHHYAFAPLLDRAETLDELRAAYRDLEAEFPPGGDLGFRELLRRLNR